jgi:LacI family transcriptional regulator
LLGFKKFCEENKFKFPPIVHGNWEYESGYELASELLDHNPEITAVFALNDLMASGCIDACKGRDISVPDDLSIIGFDDRKISAFLSPKLSTMGLPLKEMGVVSTKMLIDICKGQEIDVRQKLLECTYIERESTSEAIG